MSKLQDLLEKKEAQIQKEGQILYESYRDQMDALDQSVLAKARPLTTTDYWALGKQLKQFEEMYNIMEEDGNVNLLGKIPTIALDVITAVHGASVLPVFSSIQTLEEEEGLVWFRNIRATTVRGSVTSVPTVTVDPQTGLVTPQGYASGKMSSEQIGTTSSGVTAYGPLAFDLPAKAQSARIWLEGAESSIYAVDQGDYDGDGVGDLLGKGLSGTISYGNAATQGTVTVNFAVDPGAGKKIYMSYYQNFELSSDLPKIDFFLKARHVKAYPYALKSVYSMLQSYSARKRFSMSLADEVSKDLVQEINREIGGDAIRKLNAGALGVTTWDRTPPSAYIGYFDHKQTYIDAVNDAEGVLVGNAGRGVINVLIAGREHSAIIAGVPGFQKIYDGMTLGAHVYGKLDNIIVIRVLEDAILPSKEGIALWKGMGNFDAPCTYAPYMPLTTTDAIPLSPNPLGEQKAAVVWAAVESLVPQYTTKFNTTQSSPA